MSVIHFTAEDLAHVAAAATGNQGPDLTARILGEFSAVLAEYSLCNTLEFMERYHERADKAQEADIFRIATGLLKSRLVNMDAALSTFTLSQYNACYLPETTANGMLRVGINLIRRLKEAVEQPRTTNLTFGGRR